MRTADGSTRLLSGGGIWDKRFNRWRTPEHLTVLFGDEIAAADQETLGPAHILTVEASQVEYVQAFGQWLKSYKRNEPRPSFADAGGEATWRQDLGNGCPDFVGGGGHPIPNAHGWAAGYVCGVAGCAVLPGTTRAARGHPAVIRRAENKRNVEAREMVSLLRAIPEKWWHYRPHPTNGYMFAHGSRCF